MNIIRMYFIITHIMMDKYYIDNILFWAGEN